MEGLIGWVIKYWVEAFFSLISAGLLVGYRKLAGRFKVSRLEQEAIRDGIRALLRDRIIQAYHHYMERGSCPIYALENITNLYQRYHSLGGNGTVTQLVAELKELPK